MTFVGRVVSPLSDPAAAPKQGDEGAPDAWLEFEPAYADALDGLAAGDAILVLTWLHHARRDVLRVHPRDDPARPLAGVFSTRSADRPNPIGVHRVPPPMRGERRSNRLKGGAPGPISARVNRRMELVRHELADFTLRASCAVGLAVGLLAGVSDGPDVPIVWSSLGGLCAGLALGFVLALAIRPRR